MKKILIVEDEEILAELFETVLKDAGYEVTVVYNGMSALEHLGSNTPDLVTLDLKLPDINGLDILEKIREKSATTPKVIVCSGDESFKTEHASWVSKISGYFPKPVELVELRKKIKEVLGE